MARDYDKTDLVWTSRGDLFVGSEGDLMDTEYDPLRSVVQEILTRLRADFGDWQFAPNIGAQLSDFVGEPNNKTNAENIKSRILSILSKDNLVGTRDVNIRYIPITHDRLMYRVSLKVAPTPRNGNSETLVMNFMYSYSDNNVYSVR
jgi:hypothetical protein